LIFTFSLMMTWDGSVDGRTNKRHAKETGSRGDGGDGMGNL
jgi:hypothetical protein